MTTMVTGTTDLAEALKELGVDVRRVGEKEISGCCPVHLRTTGKVDRSPSWSMNASTGAWLCYSCGARGSLFSLVSELSGDTKSIWDIQLFLVNSLINRIDKIDMEEPQPDVDWISYSHFSDVPQRLLDSKNLDSSITRKYGVKWNPDNKSWVIPIVSRDGELMGWQEKKKDWVRNYPVGIKKSESLFGIERFTGGTAVLLESPLDVVRLAAVTGSVQGLATFGAYVSKHQISLLGEVATKVIIAMDNDTAGIESAERIYRSLPRMRDGVLMLQYKHTDAKDIGDMTDADIMTAINNASIMPWWL